MYKIFILLILLISACGKNDDDLLICNGVYDGDITLTTQEEVNNFASKNYCSINGTLKIENQYPFDETTNITDISGLQNLQLVQGNLVIYLAYFLDDLKGLENITEIGGSLTFRENINIHTLKCFSNLKIIGKNINIVYNKNLLNLEGFENLTKLNDIQIIGNKNIINLKGLNGLEKARTLWIKDNESLTSLEGLDSFKYIESLLIQQNPKLESLIGINSLEKDTESFEGDGIKLSISENHSLIDLMGLEKTQTFSIMSIVKNNSLKSLKGLENVSKIHSLNCNSNNRLSTLEHFDNLTSIGPPQQKDKGSIYIQNNDVLLSLKGFQNINYFNADIWISGNAELKNLCDLQSILMIGSYNSVNIHSNKFNPKNEEIINNINCYIN